MGISLRLGLAVVLLASWVPAQGAQPSRVEPGRAQFDAGVATYRAGDRDGAARLFERARAAGYATPQLTFNLGLCYYQLRRYAEARAQFEALRAEPGYAGVADFHLALVAAREGDRERAQALWRSLAGGSDAALAQRAEVALGRLDAAPATPYATGYLLVAAGHDSNPALLDESQQPAGGGESADVEVFGTFNWPLSRDPRAFTALRGGFYLKDYTEDVEQDPTGYFAGLARDDDDGARHWSFGLDASASELDGEAFQQVFTLQALRAPSREVGWRFGAQLSRIDAAEAYAHLDGQRARLSVARAARLGGARTRLGYELELNDRADLEAAGAFLSYSPLRHRLELVVEHAVGTRTTLRWNLRARRSRYRDPNVSQGVEERREETLVHAGLQLRRQLGRTLFALAELQYSRNAATPATYDYDRSIGLLGLEWAPVGK